MFVCGAKGGKKRRGRKRADERRLPLKFGFSSGGMSSVGGGDRRLLVMLGKGLELVQTET